MMGPFQMNPVSIHDAGSSKQTTKRHPLPTFSERLLFAPHTRPFTPKTPQTGVFLNSWWRDRGFWPPKGDRLAQKVWVHRKRVRGWVVR